MTVTSRAPWYDHARRFDGLREVPGPGDNPQIIAWAHRAGVNWYAHDATAWCAVFVGGVLADTGFKGTGSALARSFLDWGRPVKTPYPGCIAVFSRTSDPNKGHVGFYVRETSADIICYGGNQSDAVNEKPVKKRRLLGYREPLEWGGNHQIISIEPPSLPKPGAAWLGLDLEPLLRRHRFNGSVEWSLTPGGLQVNGIIERTPGDPETVRRIWAIWKDPIVNVAARYRIPVELIIATIATESEGDPHALRKEPGYKSDAATPHKVSPGLMQTLISTAREALGRDDVDRAFLLVGANSIEAGTAYIARQRHKTLLDPPKVLAAYNAGGVYENGGRRNRWKMKQYPIGTGDHCDRGIEWFNDAMAMFAEDGLAPAWSFHQMLNAGGAVVEPSRDPAPAPGGGLIGLIIKILSALFGAFTGRK